jgi:hypothetical protein
MNLPPSFPLSYYDLLNGEACTNCQLHGRARCAVSGLSLTCTAFFCLLPSVLPLVSDGHVLSTYRCRTVGRELSQFGTWLSELNRGAVTASHYTASSSESRLTRVPVLLSHMQTQRQRNAAETLDQDGDRTRGHASEQLQMTQWTQQELDEFVECGTTLQNLAELY